MSSFEEIELLIIDSKNKDPSQDIYDFYTMKLLILYQSSV